MKKLNQVFDGIAIVIFVLMVAVVIMQVFFRYVMHISAPWTEELSRLLFIYIGFMGTAIATRENEFIVVDIVLTRLPAPVKKVADVVINIIIFAFYAVMFVGAIKMFMTTKDTYYQSMPFLSNGWTYVAVIVGMAASLLSLLVKAIDTIRKAGKQHG